MSQPKRFDFWMYQKLNEEGQLRARMDIEFSEHGRCVHWEDYAALKAENERLRKAGDEMDAYLKRQDGTTNGMLPCREAWLTAKEGRDAK